MAATITVRANYTGHGLWDPQRGQGLQNFLSDLDAVAQIIRSTLLLLQGEWFANLSIGTPLFQSILGVPNTTAGVGLILRARILSVPYVNDIENLVVTYSGTSRQYSFSCLVLTQFGSIPISSVPLPGVNAAIA
jgi:hypothetical protein